jgi:DNA primase
MTAPATSSLLSRVVEHYHRTFCERKDAQEYLAKRGLTDLDVLRAFKVGYADGSLLKTVPKNGEVKDELLALGIVTKEGRELLGGCVVVPIPDPLSGEWTTLYGRGMRTPRHCYLTGPLRGVLNYQAARSGDELILTESVLDALSFHQAGISTAIPIYGTNGFTADHLDLLKREGVRRVILALDGDAAGRKATAALKEKLASLGIVARVMPYPPSVKDPNELLVSCNGNAQAVFAKMLEEAEPRPAVIARPEGPKQAEIASGRSAPLAMTQGETSPIVRDGDSLVLRRDGLAYHARVYAPLLGRLRATVKVERGSAFHVDSLDLYASRSRSEFTKRAAKALTADAEAIERDLLALLVEAEKTANGNKESGAEAASSPPAMSDADRVEALALLKRPDLLDQVAKDVDALGFVGEETNKRLLYLVAISR